MHRNKEIILLL